MLGLENELYATHELHYVFVYVEYLLGWLGACLVQSDKIRQQTDAQGNCYSRKSREFQVVCRLNNTVISISSLLYILAC